MKLWITLLWLLAAPAFAQPAADAHLLSGARAFRDGDYARALVEFRVAEKRGASVRVQWYLAATLQKLGRNDDALYAFAVAERTAPAGRNAVLTWYEAVASHDVGLFTRADALAARVASEGGPKLAEQAQRLRAQMANLLGATPTAAQLEFHLSRARALATRREVALLYVGEARALAQRTAACARCDEIDRLANELGAAPLGAMAR